MRIEWRPPKARKPRPRGFAEWQPQDDAKALLRSVDGVLLTFSGYLPLTIRQVFYRLVATINYPKTERAYKTLCNTLNRARRAGLVSWDAIRDDGFARSGSDWWQSAEHYVEIVKQDAGAGAFRIDRQQHQPRRVVLWCEAGGMVPQLRRAGAEWSVPVFSSGGFDSVTVKHQQAREFAALGEVAVLHVGDHDPSGVHVFGSLDEDIRAFLDGMGGSAKFVRLAVTPEQIRRHDLPTSPPKDTDRRVFHGETVQAEALPPDVLAGVVRDAVTSMLDLATFNAMVKIEDIERHRLARWAEALPQLPPR